MTLPPYAATPIGRALIAELIATRPEPRVRQHRLPSLYGGYPDGTSTTYSCKPAALLRRLHDEWLERQFAALDAQFAVTGVWDEGASKPLCGIEKPDDLIQRLLAEGEQSQARAAA